jgi:hypothetical protein
VGDTPQVRARPRDELRSRAARTSCSLTSADLRTVANTPPKPHPWHLYLGFPGPLLPFRTMSSLPHFLQARVVVTMFFKISRKLPNHSLLRTTFDLIIDILTASHPQLDG